MNVTVQFLGAASEVTGSKYLLRIDRFKLLVDCGMFQGRKELQQLNWDEFPIEPSRIDAVIITHAHLDHTGYLPRLIRNGFRGPVYCTTATAGLMNLILMDSAKIQEEDASYANLKVFLEDRVEPLYTTDDVIAIEERLKTCVFEETVTLAYNIHARFYNAGHILGAAIVELILTGDEVTKTIVFSGDLGRYNDPILFPPHPIEHADVLFVESTYGNKSVKQTDRDDILEVMNEAFENDGCVVLPAFSVGRTQTLLMYLKNVLTSEEIPPIQIIVDSPMAVTATTFYRQYQDFHKLRGIDLDEDESFMTFRKHLFVSRTVAESKSINDIVNDAVIIASSGMMTGGRIMHHLSNRLADPRNVILISGYQPAGSIGRQLQEGAETVRIFKVDIPVQAKVFTINGLSAHADRDELLRWLSNFKLAPEKTFAVHGEEESAGALARTLCEKGWNASVPTYLENVLLFNNI